MVRKGRENVPRIKSFFSEIQARITPVNIWMHGDIGHNQDAKNEVNVFNQDDVFSTSKPERLIERILHIATDPGDLVLDSFLGSGTTAAVAHKMGRRWIGVEMGEHAATVSRRAGRARLRPSLQWRVEGPLGGRRQCADAAHAGADPGGRRELRRAADGLWGAVGAFLPRSRTGVGDFQADPLRCEGADPNAMQLKGYQTETLDTLRRFLEEARVHGPAAAYAAITGEPEQRLRLRGYAGGEAARTLTDKLVGMGFDEEEPRENIETESLLDDDDLFALREEAFAYRVPLAPEEAETLQALDGVSVREAEGGEVEITVQGSLGESLQDEIAAALPAESRRRFREAAVRHRAKREAVNSPAERGETLRIPGLAEDTQGEFDFAAADILIEDHDWALSRHAAVLAPQCLPRSGLLPAAARQRLLLSGLRCRTGGRPVAGRGVQGRPHRRERGNPGETKRRRPLGKGERRPMPVRHGGKETERERHAPAVAGQGQCTGRSPPFPR